MAEAFEQISLFKIPASPEVHPNSVHQPPVPLEQHLPANDPRNGLDETQVASQFVLLLRSLNYSALKHSNLSHKYKLVKLLACEAKVKAGHLSPTHSVRNAYMTLLKDLI